MHLSSSLSLSSLLGKLSKLLGRSSTSLEVFLLAFGGVPGFPCCNFWHFHSLVVIFKPLASLVPGGNSSSVLSVGCEIHQRTIYVNETNQCMGLNLNLPLELAALEIGACAGGEHYCHHCGR